MTPSGRCAIAFTVVGADFFPSAGCAGINARAGTGDVHVAATGAAPADGFTGVNPTQVELWGDYGAAAVVGNSVWIATEYIPSTPRTVLANWGTRISEVTP